jgi:DNA-binding transcriptional regulator YhcF (GntR family)
MPRSDPQINVRTKPDGYAILEAAAFVENKGTPGKLVQELVDEAIDRYAKLSAVKKVLEARAEQMAANEGKLTHLSQGQSHSAIGTRPKSG